MVISCFSFTEICKLAAELMPSGGSLLTLTYGGSTRVVPCYNVMGVAKAALETSVRYLASDFGPLGIRVNALSAGPMRTLAGAGISDARPFVNSIAPMPVPDIGRGQRRCALSAVGSVGAVTGRCISSVQPRPSPCRASTLSAFGEGRKSEPHAEKPP
jgi:enoyl-[acyl-carrier-protein] reductase (NADH)